MYEATLLKNAFKIRTTVRLVYMRLSISKAHNYLPLSLLFLT